MTKEMIELLAKYTAKYYQCKQSLDIADSPINRRRVRNAYADMMDMQEYLEKTFGIEE